MPTPAPFEASAWRSGEGASGPDHTDVANSLNNLAGCIANQRLCRCRAALQAQPHDQEKALGPEHPDVASSLNNLAELYRRAAAHVRKPTLSGRAVDIVAGGLPPQGVDRAEPASSGNFVTSSCACRARL